MHKFIPWTIGAGLLALVLGVTQGEHRWLQTALLKQQLQPRPTLVQAEDLDPEAPEPEDPEVEDPEVENPEASTSIETLKTILEAEAENVREQQGQFEFVYEGRTMIVLTHSPLNRMRLVTPIIAEKDLTDEQRQNILIANFHTALDGRYAVSNGTVFAVFLHPLSTLQADDFRSALRQVAALAKNFGTTYSSDVLQFGGQARPTNPTEGLPET